jgi:hypothetical protein
VGVRLCKDIFITVAMRNGARFVRQIGGEVEWEVGTGSGKGRTPPLTLKLDACSGFYIEEG